MRLQKNYQYIFKLEIVFFKGLVIPEKRHWTGFLIKVKIFERKMINLQKNKTFKLCTLSSGLIRPMKILKNLFRCLIKRLQ